MVIIILHVPFCINSTGASAGIGAETGAHLAQFKPNLVLTGRDKSNLESVSQRCQAQGLAPEKVSGPRGENTCLRGFRPGLTQTGLYNNRRWLEAGNFGSRKKRGCTI